jgi:hypothetical protein
MRRSSPKPRARAVALAMPAPALGWKHWLLVAGGLAAILGQMLAQ